MEIAVNLAVISFNLGLAPFAKLQERLEVTVSPLTRQYLSDKDHHRVSATVMKAEAQVKRRRHWRSSKSASGRGARDLQLWEVLVITGQAGHTLEVQPLQDTP